MRHFSILLKTQRKKKKLLIRELAERVGIDAGLVSRYEKGERLPVEATLYKIADALQVSHEVARKTWLADKIIDQLEGYPEGAEVLSMVEESIVAYKKAAKKNLPQELKALLAEADRLKKEVKKLQPLSATQLSKLNEYLNIGYTYESNRIEGNTLTLQETALVVSKGITISGKSMREHLEAINHAEALHYVYDAAAGKTSVSEKLVKEMHFLILKSIDRENAGAYRKSNVRIAGSRHTPVEHFEVPAEMGKLMQYYSRQKGLLHPVILAADMHWMLAGIHPFIDGNGRTSRLLMNLILLNTGYTIANLKGDANNKLEYYNALEEGHTTMNSMPFRILVAKTVVEGLKEYLSLIA